MYRLKVNMILGGEMLRAGRVVDKDKIPIAFRKRQYVEQVENPDRLLPEPIGNQPDRKIPPPEPIGCHYNKRKVSSDGLETF